MIVAWAVSWPLTAQVLVVDRPWQGQPMIAQAVERGSKGAYADAFRIGKEGEVWMIEAVRVWAVPGAAPSCSVDPGDRVGKITLYGALDNPPVPGQPVCDCHALVAISSAALAPGKPFSTPQSLNPSVLVAPENGAWRIDFQNVRWSVPGAMDVLFNVRAESRRQDACDAAGGWAMVAGPASPAYRLRLLNEKGVPVGLEGPRREPRAVHVQVWARRTAAK